MLHDYTSRHSYGETVMQLHADNCCGQNKNNTFLQYLCWRCLTGLNTTIKYAFMMVGHTRFAPDWLAGLFKSTYRYLSLSWCPLTLQYYVDNDICRLILWQKHRPKDYSILEIIVWASVVRYVVVNEFCDLFLLSRNIPISRRILCVCIHKSINSMGRNTYINW